MIKKELIRKKGSLTVVFLFILLSTLLISSGLRMILKLNGALEGLFEAARIPHMVQMHAGDLDQEALEDWAQREDRISQWQIVEMVTGEGSSLFLKGGEESEENSIMDISFVKQNEAFDFLLNRDNKVIHLAPGEIGVPVYYGEEKNIHRGDLVRVGIGEQQQTYTVAAMVRDAQMNPAIVHSKRFLLNNEDFEVMKTLYQDREYLLEFRLHNPGDLENFTQDYLSQGLPQKGPTVDFQLFKTLNGLSDGIVGVIIIFLSILLMLIAMLCLRFTVITAIEEDYREIGVMKAIGMPQNRIRGIYLLKYFTLGATATAVGFGLSLTTTPFLMANSITYMGQGPQEASALLIPLLGSCLILAFLILSVLLILRRFRRISALQALLAGDKRDAPGVRGIGRLRHSGRMNINLFLGCRDVLEGFKNYGLLIFIFFLSSFVTILPVNFLSTLSSDHFISYMGIGDSHIRIDLHQTENIRERYHEMIEVISQDPEIARLSPLVTSQFSLVTEKGERETLTMETGDFSLFPLDYLEGREPRQEKEIALSYLNSRDLKKTTGDTLLLEQGNELVEMTISGIYQDITNGGRTAKGKLPYNENRVLWYTLSLDTAKGVSIPEKVAEYSGLFAPARVTDLETYLEQTLGNTITQVEKISLAGVILGLWVAMLITALFLRMMISRDKRRIAILRSLGFSLGHLRAQYLTTTLVLLLIGIAGGTLFANTAGQTLVSFLISFMGAARIELMMNPLLSGLALPLLLAGGVSVITLLALRGIRDYTIAAAVAE